MSDIRLILDDGLVQFGEAITRDYGRMGATEIEAQAERALATGRFLIKHAAAHSFAEGARLVTFFRHARPAHAVDALLYGAVAEIQARDARIRNLEAQLAAARSAA